MAPYRAGLQSIALLNANCKSQPAIIWIVDNQKGRRNVATKEQQDYISGKRYEAQKHINRLRDKNGVFKSDAPTTHNAQVDDYRSDTPTATRQANEEGIKSSLVRRNAQFARGVDAVREVSPELAEKSNLLAERYILPSLVALRRIGRALVRHPI